MQYAIFRRFLSRDLRSGDLIVRRTALIRWMKIVLIWQAVELIPAFAWVFLNLRLNTRGLWMLPVLGLLLGTAVALQPALARITRALRP